MYLPIPFNPLYLSGNCTTVKLLYIPNIILSFTLAICSGGVQLFKSGTKRPVAVQNDLVRTSHEALSDFRYCLK